MQLTRDRSLPAARQGRGLDDNDAAHEVVAGTAHAVAFELVSSCLRACEDDGRFALPALGHRDIRVGALDVEAVRRVVALYTKLNGLSHRHRDLGRGETEALGANPDHTPFDSRSLDVAGNEYGSGERRDRRDESE